MSITVSSSSSSSNTRRRQSSMLLLARANTSRSNDTNSGTITIMVLLCLLCYLLSQPSGVLAFSPSWTMTWVTPNTTNSILPNNIAAGFTLTDMSRQSFIPGTVGAALPVDGPQLGWTVNVSWSFRSGPDNATSDLLCTDPTDDMKFDNWGNRIAGTVLLVRRGNCAFGVKAINAAKLGAIGLLVQPTSATDSQSTMQGSQDVKIPVLSISTALAVNIQTMIKADPVNWSTSIRIRFRGGSYAAIQSDWDALKAAYNESPNIGQDANWGGSLPWSQLKNYDPCVYRFQGIYCFEGIIYSLSLTNVGWNGPVPPSLGLVSRLTSIDISNNGLTGDLPCWTLPELNSLVMTNNKLTGFKCLTGFAPSYTALQAATNLVTTIPIMPLSMRTVQLNSNPITDLTQLYNMSQVTSITLYACGITGWPLPDFTTWPNLITFTAGKNSFVGALRNDTFEGSVIRSLDLGYNNLTGVLPVFIKMANTLSTLDLSGNQLTGTFPLSWAKLTALRTVYLKNNLLRSPIEPLSYTSITILDLSYNLLTAESSFASQKGQLGVLFSGLPSTVTYVDYSYNQIYGYWTTGWLTAKTVLNTLKLNNNYLWSGLPADAFNFNGVIRILDLSNNDFNGTITNTVPSSSMQYLRLDGNQLYGGYGVLPQWVNQISPRVISPLGSFSCPQYTQTGIQGVQLFIDASYHDYTGCQCDRGTYGSSPNCEDIPATSSVEIYASSAQPSGISPINPSGQPMSTFSPNEYGDQRQTVGMDTSWLMSPPYSATGQMPVVIYLTMSINQAIFDAATDRIDVFMGNTDLSGTRVMTYLGTDSSYTGNVAALGITENINANMIVIFSRNATVNFRSRDKDGQHFIANCTYGYTCPAPYRLGANGCETGIRVGDMIAQKLSGTSIVLAFGISVLGSWTSLILVEQAIFHHLAKLVTWPWLALSSCSLGGGMWATLLIGLASISVPPLGVSFTAHNAIAPLVLPFALVYGAFYILLGRAAPLYFARRGAGSESMTMKSVLSVESSVTSTSADGSVKKRKKRSRPTAMSRIKDALKFHGLAAAILVTGALIGTHWAMFSGITIAANLHYNVGIIIIGMILGFIGCGSATHLFFHFRTSQFRFISAFIMAAGICAMHFVTLNAIDYEYNGRVLSEAPFDSTILQILGSVSMALMSFLFIGLNVVRLKLSRDHLEKDVRDARMQIESLQNLVMIERSISADLQRKLDLINLCRPITRPNSTALANILAMSGHERDEMLKIYKRALDNQKGTGGTTLGGGQVHHGGHGNDVDVLNDSGSDDDHDPPAVRPSAVTPHHTTTAITTGVTTSSAATTAVTTTTPDNTPGLPTRQLNSTTTAYTSHGENAIVPMTPAKDIESLGLGVMTSSADNNMSSSGAPTPMHREESPLLSAPRITPTNSQGIASPIGVTSSIMVQLPGTPSHVVAPPTNHTSSNDNTANTTARMSIITNGSPMPPSPRSRDGTPPPLVTGKSFGGATNSSSNNNLAGMAAMGLTTIRGAAAAAMVSPGPSSRMVASSGATTPAHKYVSGRAPMSSSNVTVPTPTATGGGITSGHYSGHNVSAPAPPSAVSVHDVGDELLLVGGGRPYGVHGNANLRDHQITLDVIMAHPVCVEILKDRLALVHASETLQLYLEIQNYKRSPQAQLKQLATDIYDAYIQVHSENQVNFGATLRESIAKRVREPRPGHQCFKEAEREAHRLLMQNAWPSFRDSVQFTMCAIIIRGLIPPPDRPRGGPSIHWQAVAAASDISTDSGSMVTDTHSRKSSLPHVGEHDIHGAGKDDDEREEKNDTDAVRTYEPVHTNASVANANANHSLPTPSMRVVEA